MPIPTIAPGAVHVWEADLRIVPDALTALLTPGEHDRASAIRPPGPRMLWPRSRALLRLLLARYSGEAAARLELRHGANGKPWLAKAGAPQFNLSHSGPIALYAFSAEGPVGVDVERAGRREDAFLRRWTRHEAAVKCLGERLGAGAGLGDPGYEPWLCELELGERALGALACRRAPAALERFSWTPWSA
ncbi:MAG: 4'-phosphopantetheinyl transferase family protein [Solirubrobacteraceae bacterium]